MMNVVFTFLAILFLFGFFVFSYSGYTLYQHARSLSWVSTKARTVNMNAENTDHQIRRIGELAQKTSKVSATFEYDFGGQNFNSNQLSFFPERTKGLDQWDQKILNTLLPAQNTDEILAWVNPEKPTEAVLLRDMRWTLFAVYFFVGLFLMAASAALLWGAPQTNGPTEPSLLAVGIILVFSVYCLFLSYFLFKDGYKIWSVISVLPSLIALNGIFSLVRVWTVKN
jgi:hypothetical protein